VLTGPFGSNLGKNDFTQTGVPILTIGCLQESGIDLSKAMYVSQEKANELNRYSLQTGDMLFSRMAAVGRAGFVTHELNGALFNYHIMRLRLHRETILQTYFVSYVRGSGQVSEYVKEVNHGATRDGINTQQLLEMPVALPPFEEQIEICRRVEEKLISVRRLESEINTQLVKAEKNKQSILSSAFSGMLIKPPADI
jgi:type I restriction enzyme S subunit